MYYVVHQKKTKKTMPENSKRSQRADTPMSPTEVHPHYIKNL